MQTGQTALMGDHETRIGVQYLVRKGIGCFVEE
jgi:hypothetical protein